MQSEISIPRMESYVVPDIDYSFLDKYCQHNRGKESRELFLTFISYVLTSSDHLKDAPEYYSPSGVEDEDTNEGSLTEMYYAEQEKEKPKHEKRMVPINWKVLRFLWGHKGNFIIRALIKEGLLVRSERYVIGEISYKYSLCKERVAGFRRKRIKFQFKSIEDRFNQHRDDNIRSLCHENPIYLRLYENVSSLVFDFQGAKDLVAKWEDGETKVSAEGRIDMEENNYRVFKKDRNGRLYTNFTVNHRVLREFYAFPKREDIYMADIGACHPWFFYSFYKKDSEEKKKFGELFSGKGFWHNLFYLFHGRDMTSEEKAAFKQDFFRYIAYGITRTVQREPIYITFVKTFPELAKIVAGLKSPSHAMLANNNMKFESKIMLRALERGQFKQFLWVHDALYSTIHEIDSVVSVLKECFAEEGLYPQIEVKKITR